MKLHVQQFYDTFCGTYNSMYKNTLTNLLDHAFISHDIKND
jgi:hypothetical protein